MATTQNSKRTPTTTQIGQLVHVSPTELLLQRNIRDAQPDQDLIASIKRSGVLVPITAVLTEQDELLIRQGHRRTLAAIEAGATTVPVYITGTDDAADTAEITRIISQRDENTHRAGLTLAEDVAAVEQLAAFGLSPTQIAKKAGIKRDHVDQALTVAASPLATKAATRYSSLTLDQAAAVAEFDHDPETVKALIVAAERAQFDHTLQRARDDRHKAEEESRVRDHLTRHGVTVVDAPTWYGSGPKTATKLTSLRPNAEADPYTGDPDEHDQCPGHVAWITWDYQPVNPDGTPFTEEPPEGDDEDAYAAYDERWTATSQQHVAVACYGCSAPTKHGHADRYGATSPGGVKPKMADLSPAEQDTARAERKLIRDHNAAWDSAEIVRRNWLAQHLAKAKTPPKGAARFVATALCTDAEIINSIGGNHLAADWLGKTHTGYGRADLSPAKSATDNRALVLALLQTLAAYEHHSDRSDWRRDGTHSSTAHYLRYLKTIGYTLSDVEAYALTKNTH